MRHLPFYGRWFRFLMTYPGVASGMEQYRGDPDYHDGDGSRESTESMPQRGGHAEGLDALAFLPGGPT